MSDADDDVSPVQTVAPPQSQAEWKLRIASASGKDLLKLVQRDKPRASRVLSGFRATEQAIKNPVVMSRVADEAMKQPGFASDLAASLPVYLPVPLPAREPIPSDSAVAVSENAANPSAGDLSDASPHPQPEQKKEAQLREQREKQRAALREQEDRIAVLERDAVQARRDLATLRAELDAARVAKAAADAEVANLRRRAERDGKRVKDAEAAPEPKPQAIVAAPAQTDAPKTSLPLEEALRRMLRRGKFAVVADVCKEAISSGVVKASPATARGAVYALYAAALYGTGEPERAADQDVRAVEAFLDAGAVADAADAFTRLLNQPTLLRSTLADDATLIRRLITLAERDNRLPYLITAFLRVRIVSPTGFNLLLSSLTRKVGKRGAEIAAALAATVKEHGASGIGADETVSLPGTALPAVSPRKLAHAAEVGEYRFVLRVRDVLAEMRGMGTSQAALVDSLLAAVGDVSRIAVLPYTTAPGFTPRYAVVDASNIARHDPDPLADSSKPRVASLLTMRDFLFRRGFFPVILIADATLRFHVDDKPAYLALVERGVVRETAPQTSADETLLVEARASDATLISNDRFAEWGDLARRVERSGFTLTQTGVALLPQ